MNLLSTVTAMKTSHDLVLAAKSRIREISVEVAQKTMPSVDLVIDVREPDEYTAGHLAGAINLPRGLLEFKLSETDSYDRRDLRAVVYCKTGGRAALAAASMQSMGYVNVVSIEGGYEAWVAAHKPIVKPAPLTFD